MGVFASVAAAAAIAFSQQGGHVAVSAPGYQLQLSARDGRIVELDDARGRKLLGGASGCLWWVNPVHHATSIGGCSFRPTFRWRGRTLTVTYARTATVTLVAHPAYFDLRLRLRNGNAVRDQIRFPAGLAGETSSVRAGYAPNVLPGVRLKPRFFSRAGNAIQVYPSRWAFADWLALDTNGGHVALYTVNRGPIAPVDLGFLHLAGSAPCSGRLYCVLHQFETQVQPGATWTSPVVRIRVGAAPQQAIRDYRVDNGIDTYPSLAAKLGARLQTLERAPLIKADAVKIGEPFTSWVTALQQLPTPIVLHPVAYQPGGHDANDPDFLPAAPAWGDIATLIAGVHARGDVFMPYDNLSWWDPASPTMRAASPKAVAAIDADGAPQTIDYGDHTGVIVSPYAPLVRQRATAELDRWKSLGSDCVFLDQVGARPWLRDFNPASPSPLAYDDGWLSLLAPYRNNCVMSEDGWDRLAADVVGFHGSMQMMQRELGAADRYFGAGNWEPFPLATWLLHDKVLMYQHDLYPLTMAVDGDVLAWNAAFGLVESYEWRPGNEHDPWLELATDVQRTLGPHYVGVPLASYTTLAAGVTRSVFGDLTVVANLSDTDYRGVSAHGFSAAGPGVAVHALPGGHWVVEERSGTATIVRQPVGGDTAVTVPVTAARVLAEPAGTPVPFSASGGGTTFTYRAGVDAYRVEP
jgi:hypothetical protein